MANAKLCSVEGCGKPVRARGWCCNHYALWQRNGAPIIVRKAAKACSVDGCEKPPKGKYCAMHGWRKRVNGDPLKLKEKRAKPTACNINGCKRAPTGSFGMCATHYQRMRRLGDPLAPLTRAERGTPREWLHAHVSHDGDDCLMWPFARHSNGEAAIGDRRSRQAARLMCIMAHGEPPSPEMQAAHSCGKGHLACVNPRHLRWATPKQNAEDKRKHGTLLMGEEHPQAKLTAAKVNAIRALAGQFSVPELAEIFEVHARTISDVLRRETWKCL